METRPFEQIILYRLFYLYFFILIIIYISSVFIIFPLFVHFSKINRKKDEESPIFPITNHLYKITIYSQFFILINAAAFIISFVYSGNDRHIIQVLFNIAFILRFIAYTFNSIVMPVHNFLLFLLAFQRFLLYFYPNSEKYISPSRKTFKYVIIFLYSLVIGGNLLYEYFLYRCALTLNCSKLLPITNSLIYIGFNILVIFSSIFYIPILISVRKISRHSSTVMKTRPERAILYQTLVLIFVKLASLPILALIFIFKFDFSFTSPMLIINKIFSVVFIVDMLTTPIVSQIAYLFCNKTHLKNLMKLNFRKLRTWMTICCGASSNSVNYEQEVSNLGVASSETNQNPP